jgi:hypothetical protein
MSYRGYFIRRNPFSGAYSIEKGDAYISYAADYHHARRIIDSLIDG